MIIGKYKGIFRLRTAFGAEFQISEVKVHHILTKLQDFAKKWSLPITDGLEYRIQPEELQWNWRRPYIQGWKLIQILIDLSALSKQLSSEYKIDDQYWRNIQLTIQGLINRGKDAYRLCNLIQEVIADHGRPMYRDIIAAMVKERNPDFNDQSVYNILATHKYIFYKQDIGVYGLMKWE